MAVTAKSPRVPDTTHRMRWVSLDHPLHRALVGGLLLSLVLAMLAVLGQAMLGASVVVNFLISVVAVVALGTFVGNSGILSFGHVGFVAIGAYASGLLTIEPAIKEVALPDLPGWLAEFTVPFPLALLIAVVLVGVVGLAVGVVVARLPGYSAAISTLGFLVIVHVLLLGVPDFTLGAQTFYGVPPVTNLPIALATAIGAILVARIFRESVGGLQLRASREDDLAVQSLGANVRALRLRAWVLSAMLAGAAGVLSAHFLTAFSPREFYFTQTFSYIVMVIVGGSTTVSGAVGGTALVMVIVELLRGVEGGFSIGNLEVPAFFGLTQVVLALTLLGILYFRREGLFGRSELDEWLYRRLGGGRRGTG